jgi:cytochrome c oxidase assembly protein subunit 15
VEYSHRTFSGLDGFLILVLAVWSFLTYRHDFRVKLLGFLSLFFVVLQGGLGALTVVFEGTFTKFPLLALHFGFSLISFASVVLLAIRLFQIRGEDGPNSPTIPQGFTQGWRFATWGLAAYTYIVVYTGALVRHTNSTTACGREFPLCDTTYTPNFTSASGIQMLHRYAAAAIWLLLLVFLVMAIRRSQNRRDVLWGSVAALILASLQGGAGIMVVASGGLLAWALVHTTIVAVLFAVLSYLCMQVGWPWSKQQQHMGKAEAQGAQAKLQTEYV